MLDLLPLFPLPNVVLFPNVFLPLHIFEVRYREMIADAIANPPTQAEIDQELANFDVTFANQVEQSRIQAGAQLADDVVNAVDIRESVASPETFLQVFRAMKARFTAEAFERQVALVNEQRALDERLANLVQANEDARALGLEDD